MPQFDVPTFPAQIFWLIVTFVILYLLMTRIALPKVGQALDERRNRIEGDLDKAEQLKKEAEEALQAYERMLSDARTRAQLLLKTMTDKAAEEAAAKQAELAERMAKATKEAEARIDAARDRALGEIRSIAVGAAEAAAARLIGVSPPRPQVEATVEKVLAERS